MYQDITIVGHLGGEPVMRYLQTGRPVTNFSVATNRRWTNAAGEPVEETCWFRVATYGVQAENCNQYLSKGRLVLVKGVLRPDPESGGPRIWTGDDGVARASFEVVANNVRFLGGRGEAAELPEAPATEGEEGEDEIPF